MRASAVLDDKVRLQPDFEIIVDLVRRCVEVEAAERPTAEAICRHAFFGNGGWSGRLGWRPPTESVQH